jgi:hypothetical protein
MPNGLLTESERVAKRKKPRGPGDPPPSLDAYGNARVEFVAPPEWLAELDAAARQLGMRRSAYIRMACTRQMAADRKDR